MLTDWFKHFLGEKTTTPTLAGPTMLSTEAQQEKRNMTLLIIRLTDPNNPKALETALKDPETMKRFSKENIIALARHGAQFCDMIIQSIDKKTCAITIDEETRTQLVKISANFSLQNQAEKSFVSDAPKKK